MPLSGTYRWVIVEACAAVIGAVGAICRLIRMAARKAASVKEGEMSSVPERPSSGRHPLRHEAKNDKMGNKSESGKAAKFLPN
jgi:hypothetical protein